MQTVLLEGLNLVKAEGVGLTFSLLGASEFVTCWPNLCV